MVQNGWKNQIINLNIMGTVAHSQKYMWYLQVATHYMDGMGNVYLLKMYFRNSKCILLKANILALWEM